MLITGQTWHLWCSLLWITLLLIEFYYYTLLSLRNKLLAILLLLILISLYIAIRISSHIRSCPSMNQPWSAFLTGETFEEHIFAFFRIHGTFCMIGKLFNWLHDALEQMTACIVPFAPEANKLSFNSSLHKIFSQDQLPKLKSELIIMPGIFRNPSFKINFGFSTLIWDLWVICYEITRCGFPCENIKIYASDQEWIKCVLID